MKTRRNILGIFGVAALVSSLIVTTPGADAQVASSEADFGGFATGTILHADAIEGTNPADDSTTRLVDVEVASSNAAADSTGLTEEILSEVERIIQPALPDQNTYGRGMALEAGVGLAPPSSPGQIQVVEPAEASAPPSTDLVTQELLSLPPEFDPLAWATALRGQAEANWVPEAACALGEDLSFGHAEAADVQLLDQDQTASDPEGLEQPVLSLDAPDNGRSVVDTTSRTRLVPQVAQDGTVEGDALGVMSETRMTIAPVTINLGGEAIFTIEVLGEWVLRAVATGNSGYVHYGPGEVSPETPILRIIDQTTGEVSNILRFQDVFGEDAIPASPLIEIPELGLEIAIGENPRAIGGPSQSAPTETATEVSAAVDVLRVRLLDGGPVNEGGMPKLADLRLGHMEVQATVPQGGVACELPVTKSSNPEAVTAGDDFTYTITVDNPFQCTLTDVTIVDEVSASEGVTFSIDGASDGGTISGNTVTWDDLDDIPPGESISVTIDMSIPGDSAAGVVIDEASAEANCALGDASGDTTVDVGVSGETRIELPEVAATEVAGEVEEALPATGGPLALGAALGLLGLGGLGAALRRFGR